MPWPRFRNPIQKLIVPTADLGLGELDFSGLQFPTDVPLVLALQVQQTPAGPRIIQGPPSSIGTGGVSAKRVIRALTTEGAGSSIPFDLQGYSGMSVIVEILALAGAPTNIQYRPAFTIDGGTTWYQGANAQATTTGVVALAFGVQGNNPAAGNQVLAQAGLSMNLPDQFRIDWVFTGGVGPTVQHRMTGLYR